MNAPARKYLKDDPKWVWTACPVCHTAGRTPPSLYEAADGLIGCDHCGEHPWEWFATALGPSSRSGNDCQDSSKTIRTTELTVEKKTVCIVVFRSLRDNGHTPEVHYQVTLDPAKVSPSGQFIRMGTTHGDEIHGWQPIRELVIVEKLAEWAEGAEDMPVLRCRTEPLTFDFERVTEDAPESLGVIEGTARLVSGG